MDTTCLPLRTLLLTVADSGSGASNSAIDSLREEHRILLCDRDTKFAGPWKRTLEREGNEIVSTPYRAPNANAYAERFVRSIKSECLRRMVLFGERGLRRALADHAEHDNEERPHQGVGNRPLLGLRGLRATGRTGVVARERLGGVLRTYERPAA